MKFPGNVKIVEENKLLDFDSDLDHRLDLGIFKMTFNVAHISNIGGMRSLSVLVYYFFYKYCYVFILLIVYGESWGFNY